MNYQLLSCQQLAVRINFTKPLKDLKRIANKNKQVEKISFQMKRENND